MSHQLPQHAPEPPPDVRVPGRRVAQKFGWGLLALFVLAGAAGLFGVGPTISVPRLALLYLLLMALFRLAGRRTLADVSPFDFVLLPIISELVQHGQPIERALRVMRIDETDILAAARQSQGLERMDQIRFAMLEKSGGISIVPEPEARA